MNADPDEGQPTTAPEATEAATVPPEMSEAEADVAEPEADAPEAEAGEAEAEADEAEAEPTDAKADAEASSSEPEPDTAEAEPEGEAEPVSADAKAQEATSEPEPDAAETEEAESKATQADATKPIDSEPTKAASEAAPSPTGPEPPAPDPSSLVAGRYRLVSLIGGGAMGVVWRARDEVLGRDVAVKELRPDHGMSGAQVRTSHQRARREGRIAARLQHPNAVVIYDVAEHDGRPYLIMEYVPSQSLGDILATGTVLAPTEVTSIGAQLASALTAAHERGIVHRDIKPGNVLMTTDGTVKLTDFGISRATGDATVTATGEILGTPAYTAPEVAQGHPVAFPADVFSLGATLYAAVEGIPPFGEDANAMATLLRVVRNEMRRPKRSGPLTDTILWMLSPEPIDRPTMKEVWQGLDALSTKPLPPLGLQPPRGETRPFGAPSPTVAMAAGSAMGSVGPSPMGAIGPMGAMGAIGPVAATGRTDAKAAPGTTGQPGTAGTTGTTGPTTTSGATGTTGTRPAPEPILNRQTSSAALPKSTTAMPADPIPTTAMTPPPKAVTPLVPRQTPAAPATPAASAATPPPPTTDRPARVESDPPPSRPRSRMPLAIAICVVGTTVLIVAIIVAMNSSDNSSNQPGTHGSTTPTQSAPGKPASSNQPSTTPSNTPTTSGSSQTSTSTSTTSTTSSSSSSSSPSSTPSTPVVGATDPAAFVRSYYGLLPTNLDAAWPQMTAAYQTAVAGGRSNYDNFWNSVQSVTVSNVVANVVATGQSTVTADIHITFKSGGDQPETDHTTFGLVKNGKSWQIDTSHNSN